MRETRTDVVEKNGDRINIGELSRQLGCKVVKVSALKGNGTMESAEAAIDAALNTKTVPQHTFSGAVEHAIAHIEEAALHDMPQEQQRWYAIKIFERDDKALEQLNLPPEVISHIEEDINAAEAELDDDAESIIANERYVYIAEIMKSSYKKKNKGKLSVSDKIDKVVTNRFAAIGAIRREMNSAGWTCFAIGYQCIFAYSISLIVFQLGSLFTGGGNIIGVIAAFLLIAFILFMLFKPYKEANKLTRKIKA